MKSDLRGWQYGAKRNPEKLTPPSGFGGARMPPQNADATIPVGRSGVVYPSNAPQRMTGKEVIDLIASGWIGTQSGDERNYPQNVESLPEEKKPQPKDEPCYDDMMLLAYPERQETCTCSLCKEVQAAHRSVAKLPAYPVAFRLDPMTLRPKVNTMQLLSDVQEAFSCVREGTVRNWQAIVNYFMMMIWDAHIDCMVRSRFYRLTFKIMGVLCIVVYLFLLIAKVILYATH